MINTSVTPFFKRKNGKRLHDLVEPVKRTKKNLHQNKEIKQTNKKKEKQNPNYEKNKRKQTHHNHRDTVKSSNTSIILSGSRQELVRPLILQFITDGHSCFDIHIHHQISLWVSPSLIPTEVNRSSICVKKKRNGPAGIFFLCLKWYIFKCLD